MKAADLLRAIGTGKSKSVIVFHGEERWFADQAVEALCGTFLEGDREALESVDGRKSSNDTVGVPIAEVLDDARTAPMFGGKKLIYLRMRAAFDAEELKGLLSVAKAQPEHTRLVVRMRSLKAGDASRLTRAGAAVGEAKRLFEKPWPGKPESSAPLNQWIVGRARERGLRIRPTDAVLLSRTIGNDLGALDTALSDLTSEAGAAGEITEEVIRGLTGRGREFDAFAFGEAIYDRDAAGALRVCRSSFTEGVEGRDGRVTQADRAVVGRLVWSSRYTLEKVYAARRLLDDGLSGTEAVRAMGKGNKAAQERMVGQALRFSGRELREHFRLIAGVEAELRQGLPAEPLICRLVIRLVGKADG